MILNLNGEDNTGTLITELNDILSGFKSEINTMLTEFTNDINSDMTAISSEVVAMKGDISTVNSNVSAVKNDVATVSSKVSTMSTAVNNLGGAVKSIQRGTARGTTPSAGNAPSNVTINISKVNPSKSIVLFSVDSINSSTTTYMPRIVSFSETSITVTPVGGYNNGFDFTTLSFGWQVIEFY